jgi:phosphotransferase system enzyme I (PtsI)
MCGEMAGDPCAVALLLGLGLDEFSMSVSAIPQVKRVIRGVTVDECRALAEEALAGTSCEKNTVLINAWTDKRFPRV